MNKPVFSRPPLLIGIGGTTRPGSSTERALAAALAHARTLGAQTQLFGGAELAALPPFNPEVTTRTPQEVAFVEAVRQADGILLASPGYHGGVSGPVKMPSTCWKICAATAGSISMAGRWAASLPPPAGRDATPPSAPCAVSFMPCAAGRPRWG